VSPRPRAGEEARRWVCLPDANAKGTSAAVSRNPLRLRDGFMFTPPFEFMFRIPEWEKEQ